MPLCALVVDDDAFALKLAHLTLQRAGFRVRTASTWPEVTPAFYSGEIDVVLMDMEMPGLHGDQIVQILRQTERGRRIPMFFVSNLDEDELRRRAEAAGAAGWFQKPLTSTRVQTLRRSLDSIRATRAMET